MIRPRRLGLWAGLLLCQACAGPVKGLYPPAVGEPHYPVHLVSHGWHTGVVVRVADVPPDRWPERADFPLADYLEVGWGDRDFYRAATFSGWVLFKAAAWPTASVLHVVGFRGPVEDYFPHSEVVRISVSRPGLDRLIDFIHSSHARAGAPRAAVLGPGLYGDSRFYPSPESFHLLRTCNIWSAQALRATGFPVTVPYALTTGNLLYQARRDAEAVRPARP